MPLAPGTLTVVVHEARGLRDEKAFGTMDPYVVVSVEPTGDGRRTQPCEGGGITPHWSRAQHGAALPLLVDARAARLDVAVWSTGLLDDDFVGSAVVDLRECGTDGSGGDAAFCHPRPERVSPVPIIMRGDPDDHPTPGESRSWVRRSNDLSPSLCT